MTVRYEFPSMVAKDPTQDVTVRDGSGHVYALLDVTFATPLTTYDRYGGLMSLITTTIDGQTEEFYVDNNPVVWWRSGAYAFLISSYTGMLAASTAAMTAALLSAEAATAARNEAEAAVGAASAPTDSAVASRINSTGSLTRTALEAVIDALGMVHKTSDTAEDFKAILFSDGTVHAVPRAATNPLAPANLAAVPSSTAAKLTWNVSVGATRYLVYRDGAQIADVAGTNYRDSLGFAGGTYSYRVAAVNSYGMHSPLSSAVSAYLNPALNVAPVIFVKTWPATIPTAGRCIVRVNAYDTDAQLLSLALSVSTGALQPTTDPSVWILTL